MLRFCSFVSGFLFYFVVTGPLASLPAHLSLVSLVGSALFPECLSTCSSSPRWFSLFLSLFAGSLWFAVKLQKCFVDYETSPDCPSTWRWGDNNVSFKNISPKLLQSCCLWDSSVRLLSGETMEMKTCSAGWMGENVGSYCTFRIKSSGFPLECGEKAC